MPEITPARGCMGLISLASVVGGFGAGVYVGYNRAHGVDLGSSLENALFIVPSTLSGALGFFAGTDIANDPKATEELTSKVPLEMRSQAEGCQKGCGPIFSALSSTTLTLIGTYIGYTLGKSLG